MTPSDTGLSVSGAWSLHSAQCLEACGVDVPSICEDLGIDYNVLTDPDMRVPRDSLSSLWQAATEQSDDRRLGLSCAKALPPPVNNVIALLSQSSDSMQDVLSSFERFQRLVTAGDAFSVRRNEGEVTVCFDPVVGAVPMSRHEVEFSLVAVARSMQVFAEERLRFSVVRFKHDLFADRREHEEFFGCRVEFGAEENSFTFSASVLDTFSRHRSARLHKQLQALAEQDLADVDEASLSRNVYRMFVERFRAGAVARLSDLAKATHMSERTLQRRLHEHGTSVASLRDAARRDLAREWLRAGRSRSTVARKLGFSSVDTFVRAADRWDREKRPE